MTDLAAALREAGHDDVAAALERKGLAGQLRQAGRPDLADQLEASDQTQPVEEAQPPATPQPHEWLAKQLNEAQTQWHTLGGPDGDQAA
jgi:hypothetical protein